MPKNYLTKEENELLGNLSPSPRCMHDTHYISELDNPPRLKCEKCGLIAKIRSQIKKINYNEKNIIHVMPIDKEHNSSINCWCQPYLEYECERGELWLHRDIR